jgi:hypothetical protein
MKIKVGDRFIFHSSAGFDNTIEIANINDFREPDMKYVMWVTNAVGEVCPDYVFQGDDFFEKYADQIEYLGNVNDMEE